MALPHSFVSKLLAVRCKICISKFCMLHILKSPSTIRNRYDVAILLLSIMFISIRKSSIFTSSKFNVTKYSLMFTITLFFQGGVNINFPIFTFTFGGKPLRSRNQLLANHSHYQRIIFYHFMHISNIFRNLRLMKFSTADM